MPIVPHELEEFDRDLQPPQLTAALENGILQRGRRALGIVGQFLAGQGLAQSLNVLANLYLVHRLSLEAYAQFGLAIGFQNTFSVLMDLGFASTIIPLVADRREDKALVGRYVRSANHLRNRSFLVLAPVAAAAFLAIMHRHHWGVGVQLLLLASVLLSLYSGGTMAYFSAPLFIFRRLKDYYLPQALFGVGKVAVYVLLGAAGGLNAASAAGVSALYITGIAAYIRRKSQRYFDWPAQESAQTDREMLQYILPASPAILFSAFQVQIALFLVSIFGATKFMAEVAALSRIGQLFMLILSMCSIIVEPYMARLHRERLLRHFIAFIVLAAAACAPLVLIAFRWPGAYIWVIGAKYEGVRPVLGWYVLSLSMNLVAGVMWVMNRARKWVFWSGSILEVALLLSVQIGFLAMVGVKTTREAVFFNFASSFCYLIAHGYVAIFGFVKGPRIQSTNAAARAD
ncbi:MAG: hypothetical protein ABI147_06335 [Acidobacteriaceae bacterium]